MKVLSDLESKLKLLWQKKNKKENLGYKPSSLVLTLLIQIEVAYTKRADQDQTAQNVDTF